MTGARPPLRTRMSARPPRRHAVGGAGVRTLPSPLALVLLLPVLLPGCFKNVPVEPAAVPPGHEVAVHLDLEASQRLSLEAGRTIRSLNGYLAAVGPDSLTVSVFAGTRYQGVVIDNTRRNYTFAHPEVTRVEHRRFDRQRSALVGAGVLALLIYTVDRARGGGGGTGPEAPLPPEPTPSWIPR
jgi:hypothetical protein